MRTKPGNGIQQVVIIVISAILASCTNISNIQHGQVLRMAHPSAVKTLDPHLADDRPSQVEVSRVYETLFQYAYLPRPYQLEPLLAEKLPEVSVDGKTYTIRLKNGVLFQDHSAFKSTQGKGRELVAEDVAYSLKRIADPKVQAVLWTFFDGRIEGLNEWRKDSGMLKNSVDYSKSVAGLRVLDRYTVQIKLTKPYSPFLHLLASPAASIVPKEVIETLGEKFSKEPVGTGPFILDQMTNNELLVWKKNRGYTTQKYPDKGSAEDSKKGLMADSGAALPFLDQIEVKIIGDAKEQWSQFLAGKLDFTFVPHDQTSKVLTPRKDLSLEFKKMGMRLEQMPLMDVTFEVFNLHDAQLGRNRFLRQAMSLAINSDPIVDAFFKGQAIPAQGPIPPGITGYDPNFKNPYRQFNLAKAKELLVKAGHPDGKGVGQLQYFVLNKPATLQMAEFVQKSLKAIGITVQVMPVDWVDLQRAVRAKRGHLWQMSWKADFATAENFFQLFYSRHNDKVLRDFGALELLPGMNDSGFVSGDFDQLYENLLRLQENPEKFNSERTRLIQSMNKLLAEECPAIWQVHRVANMIMQPWLLNFKIHDFESLYSKYLKIDKSRQK